MRTAKDNAVCTGGNQRFDPTPYGILRLHPRNDTTLNQIHELIRNAFNYSYRICNLRRGFAVEPPVESPARRKHTYDTAFRSKSGRLYSRLHPYKRNIRPLASQFIYRSGSRRVARHHDNLTPSVYEIGGYPLR